MKKTSLEIIKDCAFYFVVFILILGFYSCQTKNSDDDFLVIVSENTPILSLLEAFDFENANQVFLGEDDELAFSNNLTIFQDHNHLVIFDKAQNQIFLLNSEGNLKRKIGQAGNGPAEYNSPSFIDADFDNEKIYVLCNSGFAIKQFSFEGNFLRSTKMPVNTSSFAVVGHNSFLIYSGYYGDSNGKRLHFVKDSIITESLLPIKTNAFDFIEPNFFPTRLHKGLFRESFFPEVYKFDNKGLTGLLRFDFGKFSVTGADLAKATDPYDFFFDIDQRGFATTRSAFKGKDFIVVQTMQQQNGKNEDSFFIINLNDSTVVKVNSNKPNTDFEDEFFHSMSLFAVDHNDIAFFLADPQFLARNEFGEQTISSERFATKHNTNSVIIKVPILSRYRGK